MAIPVSCSSALFRCFSFYLIPAYALISAQQTTKVKILREFGFECFDLLGIFGAQNVENFPQIDIVFFCLPEKYLLNSFSAFVADSSFQGASKSSNFADMLEHILNESLGIWSRRDSSRQLKPPSDHCLHKQYYRENYYCQ